MSGCYYWYKNWGNPKRLATSICDPSSPQQPVWRQVRDGGSRLASFISTDPD